MKRIIASTLALALAAGCGKGDQDRLTAVYEGRQALAETYAVRDFPEPGLHIRLFDEVKR